MPTVDQAEMERRQAELGERFITQLGNMFAQTRTDLAQQFMPRTEAEARMEHVDQAVEKMAATVEKLAGNVANLHENVPRIYAEKAEVKADIAELRTEIEKLKTARDSDKERGWGFRYEDLQGRFQGDVLTERGLRGALAQRSTQSADRMLLVGLCVFTICGTIIIDLLLKLL